MKNSVIKTLLCFVGFSAPGSCVEKSSWKSRKYNHLEDTRINNKLISTNNDLRYFADKLKNEKNFQKHLEQILIPRAVGTENHEKVKTYISQRMKGLGWHVDNHEFEDRTPLGNRRFTNVIATLNPQAPRRMVLACHYDSLAKPEGFVGATDSAVPCAQLINLAFTLRHDLKMQKLQESDITLQLIFFDGEEAFVRWTDTDSIYGSRALAKKWQNQSYRSGDVDGNHLDRIDIFVLLDLIGTASTQFFKLESTTGSWYDRLVQIERNLTNTRSVRGTMFNDQAINAGIGDDHTPFKQRNVPILHLISYPFPKVWHKASDNRASLSMSTIENLNKILRVFVAEYLHLVP